MKKIIIVLVLIFGLTKLTAANNKTIKFADLVGPASPKGSLYHCSAMKACTHPLLPSFLRTSELTSALEKLLPKPIGNSLIYNIAKATLVASAYAVAYGVYRYNFPVSQKVHSPRIGIDVPITRLKLTITIQKNGWLAPVTINIENNDDNVVSNDFIAALRRNLTYPEKRTTGEAAHGDVALLQENQTYTFTISGNVTYQNIGLYELQEEQVITTQRGNRDEWIEAFWKKNIATRIASVWRVLPNDLIDDDRTTTYHAVITDANTQEQLHSLSVLHKENFNEQVIQALASEIFATTVKSVQIKISATTGNDHFALAPITIAIDAPRSDEDIYQGLQRIFIIPAWALEPGQLTRRAAQIAYATQLWNIAYQNAFAEIEPAQPFTAQEKISTGIVLAGIAGASGFAIKKLEDANLLGTFVATGMGIVAATQVHALYQKNNVLGTAIITGVGIAALRELYTLYM